MAAQAWKSEFEKKKKKEKIKKQVEEEAEWLYRSDISDFQNCTLTAITHTWRQWNYPPLLLIY